MKKEPPQELSDRAFVVLLQQNFEDARHIKNERLAFTNIYVIVVAATLSFLHSVKGEPLLEVAILGFLVVLATIGLITSFRLKAELEECLQKIEEMADDADLHRYHTTGETGGLVTRYMKFRWIFPLLYLVTGLGTLALLVHRLIFVLPKG